MSEGTIKVLGKADHELRCPICEDDVSVDPNTGKCSICERVFDIEEVEIVVE